MAGPHSTADRKMSNMYCDFERFDSYSLVAKVFSFCYLRLLPVSERVPEVYVMVESR